MKWSRAKTILIFLLLGVNIFFGMNLLNLWLDGRRTELKSINNAIEILSRRGIYINKNLLPKEENLYKLTAQRNFDKESRIAYNLLNTDQYEQLGGGMNFFSSEKGEILFRNGGLFEMNLAAADYDTCGEDGIKKCISDILFANNISFYDDISVSRTDDGYIAEISGIISEMPVYNGRIKIRMQDENERIYVSGRWIEQEDAYCSDSAKSTAELLLNLSDILKERNLQEADIGEIECGYVLQTQGETYDIFPVWKVLINRDVTLYINMINGQEISAE